MCLKIQTVYEVPADTKRVAEAIFPDGNLYMQIYEHFQLIFADQDFAELFPIDGQPALSPVRLTMVLILQFMEKLSDRQAAEAVKTRIDWKYLLCLGLTDQGFHYSVLSEFRKRLLAGNVELQLLDKLLHQLQEKGLLKARGKQRTDSTHVLGAIQTLTRLQLIRETMRFALDSLAIAFPDWMRAHGSRDWMDRYWLNARGSRLPQTKEKQRQLANQIGADGKALLEILLAEQTPEKIRKYPIVKTLWKIWLQNYTWGENQCLEWRKSHEIPPSAIFISSPHDLEVRYSKKRSTSWVGYKIHLSESCNEDLPRLITHVDTRPATEPDSERTTAIHAALKKKSLLPETHLVDGGYIDSEIRVETHDEFNIDLVGPARRDYRWQSRAEQGFAAEDFSISWEKQFAICPQGHQSISWTPAIDKQKNHVIKIKFSMKDCKPCPSRPKCTRAKKYPRRTITLRPKQQHLAMLAARKREETKVYKELYARRAGVEGTISQATRAFGMRRSRYIGIAKTHLQHILIAIGLNLMRAVSWLEGERPEQTRSSPFVLLLSSTPG